MFGYVNVYKPELKMKDYDKYKAYYCGLCKKLQKEYGLTGTITLSYDITFLVILLTSVYNARDTKEKRLCSVNPMKKKDVIINEVTQYAADMNIVLTYYKLMDDWQDDKSKKALVGLRLFRKQFLKVRDQYPDKCKAIVRQLKKLSCCEKNKVKDIDLVAGTFGDLMAVLFDFKQDEWNASIKKMAFYLGKFVYLIDAHEDMADDRRTGSYNILNLLFDDFSVKYKNKFINKLSDDELTKNINKIFEKRCEDLLTTMMSECADEFEKLPCSRDEILKNIIYVGVWNKYNKSNKKNGNKSDKTGCNKEKCTGKNCNEEKCNNRK